VAPPFGARISLCERFLCTVLLLRVRDTADAAGIGPGRRRGRRDGSREEEGNRSRQKVVCFARRHAHGPQKDRGSLYDASRGYQARRAHHGGKALARFQTGASRSEILGILLALRDTTVVALALVEQPLRDPVPLGRRIVGISQLDRTEPRREQ